jgi:hypothetical protein
MVDTGESYWIERAQSAEAKLAALKDNYQPALERVKVFKANFGVREHSNGTIDIDFDKLVTRLGIESCLELRRVIDEKYNISGEAGQKPKIRVPAGS